MPRDDSSHDPMGHFTLFQHNSVLAGENICQFDTILHPGLPQEKKTREETNYFERHDLKEKNKTTKTTSGKIFPILHHELNISVAVVWSCSD